MVGLVLASITEIGLSANALLDNDKPLNMHNIYADLKEEIGSTPVLSIHAPIESVYFAELIPFQPLVFPGQAEILFGKRVDAYYLDHLDTYPKYVLTADDWCNSKRGRRFNARSCARLIEAYERVMQLQSKRQYQLVRGYDLYKLR